MEDDLIYMKYIYNYIVNRVYDYRYLWYIDNIYDYMIHIILVLWKLGIYMW